MQWLLQNAGNYANAWAKGAKAHLLKPPLAATAKRWIRCWCSVQIAARSSGIVGLKPHRIQHEESRSADENDGLEAMLLTITFDDNADARSRLCFQTQRLHRLHYRIRSCGKLN